MKSLFVCLLLALPAFAGPHDHHAPASADRPSTHGMLVFGSKGKVYVSHLPMFHSPHDYQLLAELELPESAKAAYLEAIKGNPAESVYTLVPESMVLPELVAHPHPFTATLFSGHFERGGKVLTGEITVSLGKILHFRKFEKSAPRPAKGTYLLFGTAEESFTAHFVSARPDFDQIMRVHTSLISGDKALLITSVLFEDTRPMPFPARLEFTSERGHISLQPLQELYVEHGDLQ